jgi:NAD(P)H dehydrogenase (quinone)
LAAMKQANVSKLVAMSFIADQEDNPFVMSPFYGYLPRRLAGTDLDYVILKNALYADPLVPYLPELIERKGLIYPVGRQAMSFITIKDSAEAFACAATSPALLASRTTYLLAQNEPLTMPELGAIMSRVTGHEIGYNPVSVKKFGEIYASEGDGQELASMYAGGAMGYLKGSSSAFQIITGHEPESMESFLKRSYHD